MIEMGRTLSLQELQHSIRFTSRAAQAAALAYLMTCHAHVIIVDSKFDPFTLVVSPDAFHCLWDAELVDADSDVCLVNTTVTQVTAESS